MESLEDITVPSIIVRMKSACTLTEVREYLLSEPQTHGEAVTGYAEHDLPPTDNEEKSWWCKSKQRRNGVFR